MPVLIDTETGAEKFVPQAQVADALNSGRYRAREGQQVSLVDRFGNPTTVDAQDVDHFTTLGATPESQASIDARRRARQLEEEFGGVGGTIGAGVAGLARGVTFGLSDSLLTSDILPTLGGVLPSGSERAEMLRNLREVNPVASGAGEIAGAIAPALLSGGTSLAASGARGGSRLAGALARTPAGLATRAGQAAGSAARGRIAARAGDTALGRALAGGGGLAAAGATEGALFGAGQGVSELALSDVPLTAESVITALGSNALYGAALGGVALPAGAVALRGVGAASSAARRGAERGRELLAKADSALAPSSRQGKAARKLAGEQVDTLSSVARKELADADALISGPAGTLLRAKEMAGLKAAAGRAKAAQDAMDEIVGAGRASQAQRSLGELDSGFAAPAARDIDALLKKDPASFRRVLEATDELQAATRELSEKVRPFAPDDAGRTSIDELLEVQISKSEATPKLNALDVAAAADLAGVDLEGLPGIGPAASTLLKVYAAGRAFQVAKGGGGEAVRELLKGRGIAGLGGGAASGFAARAAKATGAVAARVDAGVQSFLKKARPVTDRVTVPSATEILSSVRLGPSDPEGSGPKKSAYRARRSEVAQAASGPEAFMRAVQARLTAAGATPAVAEATAGAALRGAQFLAAKAPATAPIGQVGTSEDTYTPSRASVAKWARYVRAVDNPLSVLEDMEKGVLTTEGAEALRTVYPKLFERVQTEIVDNMAELREALPYSKRLQVSILFRVPLDSTMRPGFVARMQGNFRSEDGASGAPSTSPVRLSQSLATEAETSAQRITGR